MLILDGFVGLRPTARPHLNAMMSGAVKARLVSGAKYTSREIHETPSVALTHVVDQSSYLSARMDFLRGLAPLSHSLTCRLSSLLQ
jgi:hypothetical protein